MEAGGHLQVYFLTALHTLLVSSGTLLNLKLDVSAGLAAESQEPVFPHIPRTAGITGGAAMCGFYVSAGSLNSASQVLVSFSFLSFFFLYFHFTLKTFLL